MAYNTSIGKSFGWGEVNLNLMFGNLDAAAYNKLANLTPGYDLVLNVY